MIAATGRLDAKPIRDAERERLAQQYGAMTWWGHHTREWWAMLPGRPRLLEAPSLPALEGQIINTLGLIR